MTRMIVLLFLLSSVGLNSAFALEDTKGNRLAQAERYMQVVDLKRLFRDMLMGSIDAIPSDKPDAADKRDTAKHQLDEMLSRINWDHLRAIYIDAAIQTFTADELGAAADYYSSPAGRGWLSKTPQFNALILPAMMQEMKSMAEQLKQKP